MRAMPENASKRNAYLVKNELVVSLKVTDDFVYVEFTNCATKRTTKGWIKISDVMKVEDSTMTDPRLLETDYAGPVCSALFFLQGLAIPKFKAQNAFRLVIEPKS